MIDNNDLLEYNCYNNNYYGTSLGQLIKAKEEPKVRISWFWDNFIRYRCEWSSKNKGQRTGSKICGSITSEYGWIERSYKKEVEYYFKLEVELKKRR